MQLPIIKIYTNIKNTQKKQNAAYAHICDWK